MVTSKNISIMKMLPGAVRDKRNCWSCMHKWKLWKANPNSTWQFVITCISRNTTMRVKNVHVCLIVGWRLEISHYHYLQKQRQITFKKMPWNSINMTTILLKEILCYLENANCTYNTMNVIHSVKMSVFGVILVRIFLHSDRIRRDTRIFPGSVQMQESPDQNNSEYGHF